MLPLLTLSAGLVQAQGVTPPGKASFKVQVVSSAPNQVTGGDARLHIEVPLIVPLQVIILVNGVDETAHFAAIPNTRTLTGVIDGLANGTNQVTVKPNGLGQGRPDSVNLTLMNYPITGPIFSGPQQYPFVCTVMTSGLGQPIPDDPVTGKVFDGSNNLIGYSRNCSVATQVAFKYRTTAGSWNDYTLGMTRPADMARTTTLNGRAIAYGLH